MIGIEEGVRKERKSLYGCLRESNLEQMLQAALKEKVVAEEENLQDFEEDKRRQS